MKRFCVFLIFCGLLLSMTGCGTASREAAPAQAVASYRDIPGITREEINGIEALQSAYPSFSYGYLNTTEAFLPPEDGGTSFTQETRALLSDLFGIPFTPKAYDEWEDLKRDIDAGVTDFSGEFTYTAERAQHYDMTMPIAGRGFKAYTLASTPPITEDEAMDGKPVGFLGGVEIAQTVLNLYSASQIEVVDVAGFDDAVRMLQSGELFAFVTDDVADTFFEEYPDIRSQRVFLSAESPISIVTSKPQLAPIISAIDKYLSTGGMEQMLRLYRESRSAYYKYKLHQSLTPDEQAYLADLKARGAQVNVALMHDAYPASFYNTNEKRYDGAAYDILAEVSELTGIAFNSDCMPVEKPLTDILAKLKTGEIAMMPQLLYSESRKNDYIWSSTSYITTHFALLSKSTYPDLQPFQVYYATVGTVDQSVHEEVFEQAYPGHERTLVYKTGDEAFDALEKGEIDLLMLSETMLLVQTNYREKLGYKVNLAFHKTLDTLYGFNKEQTLLRNIFDKSLAYVDVAGIEEDWLSRSYDYQRRLYRDSIPYVILGVTLLAVAFVVVFWFYVKNRRLNRSLEETVSQRTQELGHKTATLSTIYNAIPDLVFCKDVNGRYTNCNPSFEKFAGMTEAEIVGKTDTQVFRVDEGMAALFMEADRQVMHSSTPETITELITYPNGEQKLVETIKTALVRNKELIGMIGISRDITQRKEMEDKLIEAKEQAEQNSKAKSDFLSRMSHEMRTPMNAIIGMTDIGKKATDIERKDYCLDKIEFASTHLLGVINDVLDISKIEAGKYELAPSHFNLKKMLAKVATVMQFRIEEKKQTFTVQVEESVPRAIQSDEQRLSQVLTNLIGNAVKFTPEKGSISLLVQSLGEEQGCYTLRFEVQDTGIGISQEQQKKLFTSFEQGDGGVSRKFGGTGLGLAISKHIVTMMGGEIWIESNLGEGSRFIFTIRAPKGKEPMPTPQEQENAPLSAAAAAEQEPGQAAEGDTPFAGRRILLAEDVEINKEIVVTLLEPTGLHIDCAENGSIAYQMFQENPEYDLILMDIHMPEVDGYTATQMIRALDIPQAKTVPIIAMTANVFREDIERCVQAGMNAHIGKPIDFEDMMAKLRQYLPPKQ